MQKRKKGMQDQAATQSLGANELSDDQLLEASGGQATVSWEGTRDGYGVNTDYGRIAFNYDKDGANKLADKLNEAEKSGKVVDLRG